MTLGSLLGGLAAGAIVCGLFLSFQQSLTACPPESNAEGASTQRSVSLGASLMGADINEYGWLVKDEDYQTFLDILTDPRFIPDLNLPPWNANNVSGNIPCGCPFPPLAFRTLFWQ